MVNNVKDTEIGYRNEGMLSTTGIDVLSAHSLRKSRFATCSFGFAAIIHYFNHLPNMRAELSTYQQTGKPHPAYKVSTLLSMWFHIWRCLAIFHEAIKPRDRQRSRFRQMFRKSMIITLEQDEAMRNLQIKKFF